MVSLPDPSKHSKGDPLGQLLHATQISVNVDHLRLGQQCFFPAMVVGFLNAAPSPEQGQHFVAGALALNCDTARIEYAPDLWDAWLGSGHQQSSLAQVLQLCAKLGPDAAALIEHCIEKIDPIRRYNVAPESWADPVRALRVAADAGFSKASDKVAQSQPANYWAGIPAMLRHFEPGAEQANGHDASAVLRRGAVHPRLKDCEKAIILTELPIFGATRNAVAEHNRELLWQFLDSDIQTANPFAAVVSYVKLASSLALEHRDHLRQPEFDRFQTLACTSPTLAALKPIFEKTIIDPWKN